MQGAFGIASLENNPFWTSQHHTAQGAGYPLYSKCRDYATFRTCRYFGGIARPLSYPVRERVSRQALSDPSGGG
jgi:hypothetical protein